MRKPKAGKMAGLEHSSSLGCDPWQDKKSTKKMAAAQSNVSQPFLAFILP
jgi:hypothetical protein